MAFATRVRKAPWWREQHVQSSEVGSTVLRCSEQTVWLNCCVSEGGLVDGAGGTCCEGQTGIPGSF